MRRNGTLVVLVGLFMMLPTLMMGCGHSKVQLVPIQSYEETTISFLKDGQTIRSEIISKLGGKYAEAFECGRILIFTLDRKYRIELSDDDVKYHLILVFDENDGQILKKHSLVRIR